jgi:hypothetical protein
LGELALFTSRFISPISIVKQWASNTEEDEKGWLVPAGKKT